MKKFLALCLGICLVVTPSLAQAVPKNIGNASNTVTTQNDAPRIVHGEIPVPTPEGLEPQQIQLLFDTEHLFVPGAWTYYSAMAMLGDFPATLLMRDSLRGDSEILAVYPAESLSKPTFTLHYVENSFEQSGRARLYFTAEEIPGRHELLIFDLENQRMIMPQVDFPLSNMVVFADPLPEYVGWGWILTAIAITPVYLPTGEIIPTLQVTCDDLGLDEIAGSFFFGIGDRFDVKYSVLSPILGDNALQIDVVYDMSEVSGMQSRTVYQYNPYRVQLWRMR